MKKMFKQYDLVAFIGPESVCPQLQKGEVGTILEIFDSDWYEVEFTFEDGSTHILRLFQGENLQFVKSTV
jgi:Domain of unknown function (DUF4926)